MCRLKGLNVPFEITQDIQLYPEVNRRKNESEGKRRRALKKSMVKSSDYQDLGTQIFFFKIVVNPVLQTW